MPTPNRLQPDTPLEDNLAKLNQNFDVIDDRERTAIVKNGSLGTTLSGYQAGGFGSNDYGFKVAQPGYDVVTATDDQLAFSSAFNSFKIVATGTLSLTSTGAATGAAPVIATYAHGLTYIPGVIAYIEDVGGGPGTRFQVPYALYDIATGAIRLRMYTQTDATNFKIIFQQWSADAATTFSIRYYLLRETAN